MPIRRELKHLYPIDWPQISHMVRFQWAKGRCQKCKREHGSVLRIRLSDGRWYDPREGLWRDRDGRLLNSWPSLVDLSTGSKTIRVVLAAAHRDHNVTNNRKSNLRGWCQICHMIHDRPYHQTQRRITFRRRKALGDLFLGPY